MHQVFYSASILPHMWVKLSYTYLSYVSTLTCGSRQELAPLSISLAVHKHIILAAEAARAFRHLETPLW